MLFLGLAFFVNMDTAAADPGVIYVNVSSGNDAWTGQSQFVNGTNGPKKTISGGTTAVTANGIVNIANGTYTGASNRGITITKNMTIKGQSKDGTIINGSNNRIFIINSGVKVSLLNLTITNGRASNSNGGAIQNNGGNLTINNCNLKNSFATRTTGSNNVSGGAIYNTGILNVVGSTFTNNYALSGTSNNAQGGAIYSTGTLIITNSTFSGNYVNSSSGTAADEGGALWSTGISNITNSNFINNRATDGGAILNGNAMNITSSNFTNNTATDDGGAIANGNEVVPGGTVVIKNSNFINNTGVYGGAIWNTAIMTITNSTLRNNTAKYGGAVRTWGTLNMTSNTIVDNTVTSGGNGAAVSVRSGTANVNFNIIMGNTGSYEVYLESGSLNASNNVWNSTNQGNVNITTWLVLRLTSSPVNVLTGGSSTITADLNHDQNGVYYDPADGHIPDGIPITFTTNLGTINSAVMNNGTASVIFNVGYVPGVATITATTNGYTNNTTVTVSSLANVRINQTVNTPVNVGDKVTFLVTATNNGPNTATNINIRDIIPAGLTGVVVTPSLGTYNSTTGIWTIPSLLNGSSAILNITGTVSASMAGIITNNTATEISQTENNTQLPTNTVGVYTKKANVVLSQTVNSPVNVGGNVTYIVWATNNGPDNATNIIINNVLQSGLSGVSYTPSVGSYSNGVWTIPSLANGSSATLTITGIATSSMAGTNITNTATRTGQTEYNDMPNSSSANLYTKKANVVLNQTGSYNKNNVTFIVTAINNGPDNATEINIQDLIPAGLTGVILNPSVGTYNSTTGIWNIPLLANGTMATLNITGTVNTSGFVKNVANRISQAEYDSEYSESILNVHVPYVNLFVTNYPWNSGVYTYDYKQQIVMLAQVNNLGNSTATGIVVKYVVGRAFKVVSYSLIQPGNLTFDEATNTFTWAIDRLDGGNNTPMGSYASFSVLLESLRSGSGGSDFSLNSTIVGCDQNNTGATKTRVRNLIINPAADIAVNQTVNNTNPQQGDYVTITVKVKNNGPSTATGITITDLLPNGLYVGSLDSNTGVNCSSGSYYLSNGNWTINSLNNGSEVTLTIIARVDAISGSQITNRAYKSNSTLYDWNTGNDANIIAIDVGSNRNTSNTNVNLFVTNYPWNSGVYTYDYKQQIVMLAQVNNLGNSTATGIVVKYVVGRAFKVVSYSLIQPGNLTFDEATNTFTWAIDRLDGGNNTPMGSYASFSVLLESLRSGSGGSDFSLNSTIVGCDQNNTGATKTRVRNLIINPAADIAVNQTVNNTNPQQGDYVTITVKVKNNGPSTATGITITDLLPNGLYVGSLDSNTGVNCSSGSYYLSNGNWTINSLNNGSEVTLTIIARVDAISGSQITNRAYKSNSTLYDWNTGNDANEINILVK